jgi:hypothetical protein
VPTVRLYLAIRKHDTERLRPVLFDLEDPRDLAGLGDPPLPPLAGTVVIDQAQRAPDLFRVGTEQLDSP